MIRRMRRPPRLRLSFAFLAAALTVPAAEARADPVAAVLDALRQECAAFEGGTLTAPPDAVIRADLTGDGVPEAILDGRALDCSTAAALWCGTGGCPLVVVVGGETHRFIVKGWQVVDWGRFRILLTQVHGSECGGTNLVPCFEALVWSDGAFRTVAPPDDSGG